MSVIVNMTDAQYQQWTQPPSFFDSPFLWILIIMVVFFICLYFILKSRKQSGDPSEQNEYGRMVRKRVLGEDLQEREKVLADKVNIDIEYGPKRIGIGNRIEYDTITPEKKEYDKKGNVTLTKGEPYSIIRIQFRGFGFMAWFLSLFGKGFKTLVLEDNKDVFTEIPRSVNNKKSIFKLNPRIHLLNDSGVWTQASLNAVNSNGEFLLKADNENLHGSYIDNLRKQAVHQARVANQAHLMSHESDIKKQERRDRQSQFASGGN